MEFKTVLKQLLTAIVDKFLDFFYLINSFMAITIALVLALSPLPVPTADRGYFLNFGDDVIKKGDDR